MQDCFFHGIPPLPALRELALQRPASDDQRMLQLLQLSGLEVWVMPGMQMEQASPVFRVAAGNDTGTAF